MEILEETPGVVLVYYLVNMCSLHHCSPQNSRYYVDIIISSIDLLWISVKRLSAVLSRLLGWMFLRPVAWWRSALCPVRIRWTSGGRRQLSSRATDTVHISRGDRHSDSLQHFLSSSGNKTSGAGLVPFSGIDYQIIPGIWFALHSPGRHLTHIALRI